MATVFIVSTIAVVAVIIFGDIAAASDASQLLVAFVGVTTSFTGWVWSSNALVSGQKYSEGMSEAEKATRSTQCVHLTLHDGSTANAARPLQRPGLMGLPPATLPIRSAPLPPGPEGKRLHIPAWLRC